MSGKKNIVNISEIALGAFYINGILFKFEGEIEEIGILENHIVVVFYWENVDPRCISSRENIICFDLNAKFLWKLDLSIIDHEVSNENDRLGTSMKVGPFSGVNFIEEIPLIIQCVSFGGTCYDCLVSLDTGEVRDLVYRGKI